MYAMIKKNRLKLVIHWEFGRYNVQIIGY